MRWGVGSKRETGNSHSRSLERESGHGSENSHNLIKNSSSDEEALGKVSQLEL